MIKIKGSKWLLIILPVLVGVLLPCFFFIHFSDENISKPTLPKAVYIVNQPLPISKLIEIESNEDFSKKVSKGKVLLIYLSSNCAACKKDVQLIAKDYSKLFPEVQIYGISFEAQDIMLRFIKENGVSFPILKDDNSELFRNLHINYFPTKFLVKDGIIVKTLFGNFQNEQKLFEELEIGETK
jgi:peroxiredoxin